MSSQKPAEIFTEFFERYSWDAVAFVKDVLGVEPDPWQAEVLTAYCKPGTRLMTIRSGKGVGKSAILSWMAIHQLLFRYPQKTLVTSPSQPQMQTVLRPEIRKWIEALPAVLRDLLEVKAEIIELKSSPAKSFLTFRTARSDSPESLQGLHEKWVLVLVDEASDMSTPEMESLTGVLADPNPCLVLAANPLRSSGYFWSTHREFPGWQRWQVNMLESPRHNPQFPAQVIAEYGERSNAYRVQILGEFPLADDDTVIPYELVEAALKRDVLPTGGPVIWGLDVARFGDDATALCKRQGNVTLGPVEMRYKLDLMQVVGWIKNEWDETPPGMRPQVICTDVIGLGAGVVDRLRELGLPVRGINVTELPPLTGAYKNLAANLYWLARQWFERRDVRLAADETLAKQLVQRRYTFHSTGAKMLESKDEVKKRIKRSPDAADAFVLTFAADAGTALHGRSPHQGPLVRRLAGIV